MRPTAHRPPFGPWLSHTTLFGWAFVLLSYPADAQPGVSLYTIPVVVHVLHQNGNENISDAQVQSGIDLLNVHFDAPTVTIDPPYDAIAADMDVAFALATVAPDGSPTNGIDRIGTPLTNSGGEDASYLNPWPRNRYLNIWVVRSIVTTNGGAIALPPALADGEPCIDGVMVYYSFVGTIGQGSPFVSRYLTQAVGRFLNLKLLYEDPIDGGPCADDEVADTPPCIPAVCVGGPNTCSPEPLNDRNFMFTPYASYMFTLGQRERVYACLNSPVAQRNELVSGIYTTSPDCVMSGVASDGTLTRNVRVWPLPFRDHLTITGLPPGHYRVDWTDCSGRSVLADNVVSHGPSFELTAALAPGAYLLTVSNERTTLARSVIKE